jgi:hypothetical protein
MRTTVGLVTALLVSSVMTAIAPRPAAAGGGPFTYSGPGSSCGNTLQLCVTNHPGETIFVAIESVPEDIDVSASTELIAAPGFTPTVDGFDIQLSSGTRSVTLRGLTIANGIRAVLSGGSDLR